MQRSSIGRYLGKALPTQLKCLSAIGEPSMNEALKENLTQRQTALLDLRGRMQQNRATNTEQPKYLNERCSIRIRRRQVMNIERSSLPSENSYTSSFLSGCHSSGRTRIFTSDIIASFESADFDLADTTSMYSIPFC